MMFFQRRFFNTKRIQEGGGIGVDRRHCLRRCRLSRLIIVLFLTQLIFLVVVYSDFKIPSHPEFFVFNLNDTTTSSTSRSINDTEPCALLFFGLVKEFKSTIFPSIDTSILELNRHCDVYLHTYNLTHMPINNRSSESEPVLLDVSEALLLTSDTDHVMFEPISSFHKQRDGILNHTKLNFHRQSWGDCCTSHENMIKQWHSIQQVWNLMKKNERQILMNVMNHTEKTIDSQHLHYYKQVGLFRTDVYYPSPIHIFDSNAAIANFSHYYGFNDRMFYGNYKYAEIWASKRFEFVRIFESKYIVKTNRTLTTDEWLALGKKMDGYHSETFLKHLLDHYEVPIEKKDKCVMRVRSGPRIKVGDCVELTQFNSNKKAMEHIALPTTAYEPIL
jgi:hypothetical protein